MLQRARDQRRARHNSKCVPRAGDGEARPREAEVLRQKVEVGGGADDGEAERDGELPREGLRQRAEAADEERRDCRVQGARGEG